MSFSFKLRSHLRKGEPYENGQLLVDHLKGVSEIALATTRMHGVKGEIEEVIKNICMCHDFGKGSSYFQKYLRNEYNGALKNHGEISAYFTYYMLPEKWKLIGFMCVKRHHGNLEPDITFFDDSNSDNLVKIIEDIQQNKDELEEIYQIDLNEFVNCITDEKFLRLPRGSFRDKHKKFTVEDWIWLQYIWSLLLTADKTQLIRFDAYKNQLKLQEKHIKNYQEEIKRDLILKNPQIETTELFYIRNQIYDEIISSINKLDLHNDRILSVNVPTGTGKTLGVYAGALRLAERLINEEIIELMPSIIYSLPFTSIIDQNFDVLMDVLKQNNLKQCESLLLKHHSLTELKYEDSEDSKYKNYDARFCVENWQSTFITTTFVQLFNTIFQTGINSISHRFHKLAGAIIILDEVQAVPPKYFKIIEEVFHVLTKHFNSYIITVTATKPLFLEGQELVKNNKEIFNTLDRIEIQNFIQNPVNLEEFTDIVLADIKKNKEQSYLIVLNTIKSALEVFETLKKSGREVVYLSTGIIPARRIEIINEIKENKEKKYVLVSTQLIEAGVDLDFDIVYRDFSPMDSINQTSGRANRNAISGKGIVKLYRIINEDNGKMFYQFIYPETLILATKKILEGKAVIRERDIWDINNEYFKKVDEIKSNDSFIQINDMISKLNLKGIRQSFELLDKHFDKEDFIINYNDDTQKWLEQLKEGNLEELQTINTWRKLNGYRVSVYRNEFLDLQDKCYPIKGVNVLDKEFYDDKTGIKKNK